MARSVKGAQTEFFVEPKPIGPLSIRNIKRAADHFDAKGKADQHIDANLTRDYLVRHFGVARRGGRIMYGRHEIRAYGQAVIEREPAPRKRRSKA